MECWRRYPCWSKTCSFPGMPPPVLLPMLRPVTIRQHLQHLSSPTALPSTPTPAHLQPIPNPLPVRQLPASPLLQLPTTQPLPASSYPGIQQLPVPEPPHQRLPTSPSADVSSFICLNIQGMTPGAYSKSRWKVPRLTNSLLTEPGLYIPFIALTETWLKPFTTDAQMTDQHSSVQCLQSWSYHPR